jgi:hypothetical protein
VLCSLAKILGYFVRKLNYFSKTFSGKWLWRFNLEWYQLRTRVIGAKFGDSWGH